MKKKYGVYTSWDEYLSKNGCKQPEYIKGVLPPKKEKGMNQN